MKKYLIFIIIFLLSCSKVFGIDYLYDDFNSKDSDKWDFYLNGGNIEIIDNNIFLSSNSLNFPYFLNKDADLLPINNNFTFDIKFKYDSSGRMGDGISVGFTGVNGGFFEQFQLWNGMNHGAFLAYHDLNTTEYNFCSNLGSTNISTDIVYTNLSLSNGWHVLRIERINTKYNAYIDPDVNTQPIFVSPDNQCAFRHILIGGIYYGGGSDWNNLIVDYIKVYSDENEIPTETPTATPTETPTLTPTPTPVSVAKSKIIILPGLGASWNTDAIVNNLSVSDDSWRMTPFVKNYNGLINALKKNNLVENQDFYVWNYDWRRPVNEIESKLDNFINEKIGNDEKVILIGHSLGGLVSRIWAEDHKDDSRLEKVINLGSPNLGSVDTYEIWNGGQISDLTKVSSIGFKILLKIQSLKFKTDMEAARNYAPILKDLLPTFNYISKNGNIIKNDDLETNNVYLQNKNNSDSVINLNLFVGNGLKTIDSINLKNNNIFDRALGIWPDGRINKVLYSNEGDDTVLIKSASYGKSNFIEVDSKHGEIVDKTVNHVMTEIGLSQVDVIGESQDLSNNLVVFVGSPVTYSVKCDDESPVDDDDGFVVIKNNNFKSCVVNLVGTGNGLIHVVSGNTNNGDWSYWEKNIVNGEIDNVKINPDDGKIISDKNNISFLKLIIKTDINSLLSVNKNNRDLKEALKSLERNQPRVLMTNIFNFRKINNERILSEKIVNNTIVWMSLVNKCFKYEAINGYFFVSKYQSSIDNLINMKNKKKLNVSESAAVSYQKMDNLLKVNSENMKNKKYYQVCANNFAALNYGNEVLIKAYSKNDFKKWLLEDSDRSN